jgi:hypothetical protein
MPGKDDVLAVIDEEIGKLQALREKIVQDRAREYRRHVMGQRVSVFSGMTIRASTLRDARAEEYIKLFILPFKNVLPPRMFPKTTQALPEKLENWDNAKTAALLLDLHRALEDDYKAQQ